METTYIYLNQLNSNNNNYSVKVRILEKSRPKTSSKKGVLYQTLLLTDEKGHKMKATLFGDQVDSFNEAIVYNGEYIISNAPIKLIDERYRNNSDELPYQMTFGGQTVVQKINCEGTPVGPTFQSIQSIPRILISGAKYDVLGIVLYVEDKVRVINSTQEREFHVREIVVTDQIIEQPLVITAWNDLADIDCTALSTRARTFDVIGFTALRPSLHKGFSLATGMSTEIIHHPKGEKADILREWAKFHNQQLVDRQAKVLQVRYPHTHETHISIQNLRTKKASNVLQEEHHWLQVTIPHPDLKDVIGYIGCLNCGKRIDIPVSTQFSCAHCKKKDSVSAYRVTFKFEAMDDSGTMAFTTFTADTEKLFGKSAQEIYLMKHSEDVQLFESTQENICNNHVLVQVGPTTALSRNNILQWCLKGIEVDKKKQDVITKQTYEHKTDFPSSFDQVYENKQLANSDSVLQDDTDAILRPESSVTNEELQNLEDNISQTDFSTDLSQAPQKRSCTEEHMAKTHSVTKKTIPSVPHNFAKTQGVRHIDFISYQGTPASDTVKIQVVSVKQEALLKKPTEGNATKTLRKKRSLNALVAGGEVTDPEKKDNSHIEHQDFIKTTASISVPKENIVHQASPTPLIE